MPVKSAARENGRKFKSSAEEDYKERGTFIQGGQKKMVAMAQRRHVTRNPILQDKEGTTSLP